MNYITIEAKTYEEAVDIARSRYGDRLRIHSRKDIKGRSFLGFGGSGRCEITCFLAGEDEMPSDASSKNRTVIASAPSFDTDNSINANEEEKLLKRFEQEARTPDPDAEKHRRLSVENAPGPEVNPVDNSTAEKNNLLDAGKKASEELLKHARQLLLKNDFSAHYIERLTAQLGRQLEQALPDVPTKEAFELALVDSIVGSVDIDYRHQNVPPEFPVLLGSDGSGKTLSSVKLALYFRQQNRNAAIVSMDPSASEYEKLVRMAGTAGITVSNAAADGGLANSLARLDGFGPLIIDTAGAGAGNRETDYGLLNAFSASDKSKFSFYLTIPASMKNSDIGVLLTRYKPFSLSGIIVTKADETSTVGNVLSASYDSALPVLFVTEGRDTSSVQRASASYFIERLRGFSANLSGIVKGR